MTITGALLTSFRIDPWNIYAFNMGALLYLTWSLRIREWSLVTINASLLSIYAVGIFV